MAKVVQKYPKEPIEALMRRFKKKLDKENTLKDIRKKDFYLSPSKKKALKRKMAAQRRLKEEQLKEKLESLKPSNKKFRVEKI